MKKVMIVGVAALLVAGFAKAEDVVMVGQAPVQNAVETYATAEVGLLSSYVWRGQVLNNDTVVQPQVTIQHGDFSFNIWGNYDLGENSSGGSSDFSEIDMTLAYDLPLTIYEDFGVSFGLINYNFPNSPVGAPSTTELFAKVTLLAFSDYSIVPSVTLFGDIDEVNGTYMLFDIPVAYEVTDYLALEWGLSIGYGNTSYNDYYWEAGSDKGANDYNVYGNASYELAENVVASLNLTYTMLDGTIEDEAENSYEAKEKFWAGVNIAYDF